MPKYILSKWFGIFVYCYWISLWWIAYQNFWECPLRLSDEACGNNYYMIVKNWKCHVTKFNVTFIFVSEIVTDMKTINTCYLKASETKSLASIICLKSSLQCYIHTFYNVTFCCFLLLLTNRSVTFEHFRAIYFGPEKSSQLFYPKLDIAEFWNLEPFKQF
jgi:hypothetical protein